MTLEQLVRKDNKDRKIITEEVFDILKSIADLVNEGIYTNISPECIYIRDDYSAEIRQDNKSENAFFMAPEQIFEGKEAGRSSALFSFGMIFYYIFSRENWYAAHGITVYEAHEMNSSFQITTDYLPEINSLVSMNPQEREAGLHAFFRQYHSLPKGKIFISYMTGSNTILIETVALQTSITDYAKGKRIRDKDRNIYIVEKGVAIYPKLSHQKITIPVVLLKAAGDLISEIWYRTEFKGHCNKSVKVADYDEMDCQFDIAIDTAQEDRIQFLIIWKSASTGNEEKKRICSINLSSSYGQCFLHVSINANKSEMTVSLYNRSMSKPVDKNKLSYKLPCR